jgi:DNA-binding HxlR family transcriptional regulator
MGRILVTSVVCLISGASLFAKADRVSESVSGAVSSGLSGASLWMQNTFSGTTCRDLTEGDLKHIQGKLGSQPNPRDCQSKGNSRSDSVKTANDAAEAVVFNHLAQEQFREAACEIKNARFFSESPDLIRTRAAEISNKLPFIKEQMKAARKARLEYDHVVRQNNSISGLCRGHREKSAFDDCNEELKEKRVEEKKLEETWLRHKALVATTVSGLWHGETETMGEFIQELVQLDQTPTDNFIWYEFKKRIFLVKKELSENQEKLSLQTSNVDGVKVFNKLSDRTKINLIETQSVDGFFKNAMETQDIPTLELLCRIEGKYTKGREKFYAAVGAATLVGGGGLGLLTRLSLAQRAGSAAVFASRSQKVSAVMRSATPIAVDAAALATAINTKCGEPGLLFESKNSCPETQAEFTEAEFKKIKQNNCYLDAALFAAPAGLLTAAKALQWLVPKLRNLSPRVLMKNLAQLERDQMIRQNFQRNPDNLRSLGYSDRDIKEIKDSVKSWDTVDVSQVRELTPFAKMKEGEFLSIQIPIGNGKIAMTPVRIVKRSLDHANLQPTYTILMTDLAVGKVKQVNITAQELSKLKPAFGTQQVQSDFWDLLIDRLNNKKVELSENELKDAQALVKNYQDDGYWTGRARAMEKRKEESAARARDLKLINEEIAANNARSARPRTLGAIGEDMKRLHQLGYSRDDIDAMNLSNLDFNRLRSLTPVERKIPGDIVNVRVTNPLGAVEYVPAHITGRSLDSQYRPTYTVSYVDPRSQKIIQTNMPAESVGNKGFEKATAEIERGFWQGVTREMAATGRDTISQERLREIRAGSEAAASIRAQNEVARSRRSPMDQKALAQPRSPAPPEKPLAQESSPRSGGENSDAVGSGGRPEVYTVDESEQEVWDQAFADSAGVKKLRAAVERARKEAEKRAAQTPPQGASKGSTPFDANLKYFSVMRKDSMGSTVKMTGEIVGTEFDKGQKIFRVRFFDSASQEFQTERLSEVQFNAQTPKTASQAESLDFQVKVQTHGPSEEAF